MITKRPLSIFLIILSLFCFTSSCGDDCAKAKKTIVYVFSDCTELDEKNNDMTVINQNIDKIPGYMRLNDSCNFGEIHMFPMYDFTSAKDTTISLVKGGGWNQTKYLREDEINKFRNELKGGVTEEVKSCITYKPVDNVQPLGYKKSYLFENFCNQINKLDGEHADNKIIIVFSDMLEHSNIFTFYPKGGKNTVGEKFDIFYKKLDEVCSLNLQNKKLYVVFSIINNDGFKTNKEPLIKRSRRFWEGYFLSKGLKKEDFSFDTELPN